MFAGVPCSRDGWGVDAEFHKGCDDKGPTLTIVKVNTYIFGGYTEASWKPDAIGIKPGVFIWS